MQPYIGEIRMFAGNFAPRGWALCNGQVLKILEHQSLFVLLSTTYGGDGRSTFALPDLRGRIPVCVDRAGFPSVRLGEHLGSADVVLSESEIPIHSHRLQASADKGNTQSPQGNVPAVAPQSLYHAGGTTEAFDSKMVQEVGEAEPHNNAMPSLCLNFIIALEGFFPQRT